MFVYVYRRALSTGAKELAEALGSRRFRGRVHPIQQQVRAGDAVICWGETLEAIPGVRILNGAPIQNKYKDALTLKAAGVPTIEVALQKPAPVLAAAGAPIKEAWAAAVEAAEDFIEIPLARGPVYVQGVSDLVSLVTKLHSELTKPLVALQEWLPRLFNHVGGGDLLQPPPAADFWAKKESITNEIRIHSFLGKSIKAGVKAMRAGFNNPHPWVRSYDGGWSINYEGFESTRLQRELAERAVKVLSLDFGAVDMAQLENGQWIVLEVNRAPGLSDGTIASYTAALRRWMEGAAQ